MKRSRLIKCLTVTKANFQIRTTCYFFSPSSSVLCSLSLSLLLISFGWLCVCFVNIIIFRLCFQYNRHCRASHLFLSDLSKSNACCAHSVHRIHLQDENMNLFSCRCFWFFVGCAQPHPVSKRLCKNVKDAQNHSYCSGSGSGSGVGICCSAFALILFNHRTTVLSMHFRPFDAINCRPHVVQRINESLNEKWMYKSKK